MTQPVKETTIRKVCGSLMAITYFRMDGNRQLKVTTSKCNRGYVTSHGMAVEVGEMFESFTMFGDFSKHLKQFPDVTRATNNAIMKCHQETLAEIDAHLQEAKDFYAKKNAPAVAV